LPLSGLCGILRLLSSLAKALNFGIEQVGNLELLLCGLQVL
jgi:hypothetical protein